MSGTDPLGDLVGLTDVLYRAEQTKLRELSEREGQLRRALITLEERRKATASLPATQLDAIRQVGADLLWQGWIGRNRAGLNRQLALCLAQKARFLTNLRRAYGRHLAAQSLHDDRTAAIRVAEEHAQIAKDHELQVMRASRR